MYVTAKEILYHTPVGTRDTLIPAGVPVRPADNLPGPGLYWAEPWLGMDESAQSWHRNYGFLLRQDEVKFA